MKDTHEFFGLTRRFGVGRTQAFRLAPEGYARRVTVNSFREMLERSAETELPIMVFVNNPGCIQIHSGPVKRLVETGHWFNVLDPGFNLHADVTQVGEAWHVRKPTADGDVNSLELFDGNGGLLAMLFGARKPGKPELAEWTAMAAGFRSVAD
jgi:putative hemin transport protein